MQELGLYWPMLYIIASSSSCMTFSVLQATGKEVKIKMFFALLGFYTAAALSKG